MSLIPKWLQRRNFNQKLQQNKGWLEQNKPYFIHHKAGRIINLTHNFETPFEVEDLPPNERRIAHFKHFTHANTKAIIETTFLTTARRSQTGFHYKRGLHEQRIPEGMWMVCEGAPLELIYIPSAHLVRDIVAVDWQTERLVVSPEK